MSRFPVSLCLFISWTEPMINLIDRDKKGRLHFMEIQLDKTYPKSPPSISAVGFLSSLWKLKFCIIGLNYL